MITITEQRHSGGFLVSEDQPGTRSRDQVTLKVQTYAGVPALTPAGTVLGQYTNATTATYAATGGNTGNFTCGAITEAAGVVQGVYTIEFIAATKYNVYNPAGVFVAEGATGVAFSAGGLGFTITAGGTAAVAGDSATITVAVNADQGKYDLASLTATNGLQNAAAILFNTLDASGADQKVTVITRSAEVNGSELVYPSGASAGQIAAFNAQLKALGIVVR